MARPTLPHPASRINRRTFIVGSAVTGSVLTFPSFSVASAQTPAPKHLPEGYGLVTSLRLGLAGIGSGQIAGLIQGAHADWSELGGPYDRAISPMAIDGILPDGMKPVKVAKDYEELTTLFNDDPGAFAVVPLNTIDFRVYSMKIDGIDPLHSTGTDKEPIVRIGAAGDIIPGRNVANYIRKYDDFSMPLQRTKTVLSDFDLTFANFECFISETLESPELTEAGTLDFLTRPQFVPAMVDAGIDAVSMANNHAVYSAHGWGLPAFKDTFTFLNDGGVPVFGAGMDLDQARQPWVGKANGMTVALIGVDGITGNIDYPSSPGVVAGANSQATADHGGTNPLQMDQVMKDIEAAAGQYDIVIPFYHMSDQYIWTPVDWAIETAHKSIDAGASLVVGSHPHTIQGWEMYKGKPIFYGIGNFIYDQMFSVDTRQGYVLELTFRGKNVIGFRCHPHDIEAFCQPRFLGPSEAATFMDRFWNSYDLREKHAKGQ